MNIIIYSIQFIETSLLFSAFLFSGVMFIRTRDVLARRTLMVLLPISAILFISYMYSISEMTSSISSKSLEWLSPLVALIVIALIMASILATCHYVIQLFPITKRKKRLGLIYAAIIVSVLLIITTILVMFISKSDLSLAITNALWAFYPLCSIALFFEAVVLSVKYKKISNAHDQRLAKYFIIAFLPQIFFSLLDFFFLRNIAFQLTHMTFSTFSIFVFVDLCSYFFKNYNTNLDITNDRQTLKQKYTLSDREIEVVELLAKGMTNELISRELHISINTVKSHIKRIYKKLNISNRLQLNNILGRTHFMADSG